MRSVSRIFGLTVLVSIYMVKASIIDVSNWKHCSSLDALIGTLWGVALGTCAEECDKRLACTQYNYRKRRNSCELLYEEGGKTTTDKGCISGISHKETTLCECSSGEVCSTSDGKKTCYKNECEPLSVANAIVYGNVWSKESRVKISCLSDNTQTTATCQGNGEWEPLPTCLADCGSLTVENAAITGTDWSEGSSVTIVCLADNTKHTATCQSNGDWAPIPTCPAECGSLTVENADVTGTDWSEGSSVTIECLADNTQYTATCQRNGDWAPIPTCPAVDSCPTSTQEFVFIGFKRMKVCTFKKTQPEAVDACQPYGELVRIETQLQYTAFKSALKLQPNLYGGRDYWIQGQYDQDDNRWEFEDGNPFPLHDSIHSDETGNGGTPCVRIRQNTYGMVDRDCSKTFAYICMLNDT